MSSWLVNVECKKKFRDVRNFAFSVQIPVLSDFDYKGEQVDIEDIAEFMSQFGVDYSVLTVDFDLELLILVKTAEEVCIKNKSFLYAKNEIDFCKNCSEIFAHFSSKLSIDQRNGNYIALEYCNVCSMEENVHPNFCRPDFSLIQTPAQRLYAVQLLCIPFQELTKVGKVIASNVSNVRTSFLYSTGRCGSTVLCKALDQLPTLQSISEPDVFTVLGRHCGSSNARMNKETLVTITRVATLLLNNYFLSRAPEKSNICYKLRASTIHAAELLQEAMPSAKNIYMYRNCFSFGESWVRLGLGGSYNLYWLLSTLRVDSTYLWYKFKYWSSSDNGFYENLGNHPENEDVPFRHGFYWCFTYMWWRNIEKAIAMTQAYPDNFFHAILRYEDLSTRKEQLVLTVAKNLGWLGDSKSSLAEASVLSSIASVFKSNAQIGTSVESQRDRENKDDVWYGEWEKQQINDVLQYLGRTVKNGDFVVPGTI